jgi:hypothetical protein
MHRFPPRLWIEAIAAALSAVVLAVTLVWPQWIETFFGLEPDGGDGSSEWGFTLALVAITFVLFGATFRDWRRLQRRHGS